MRILGADGSGVGDFGMWKTHPCSCSVNVQEQTATVHLPKRGVATLFG